MTPQHQPVAPTQEQIEAARRYFWNRDQTGSEMSSEELAAYSAGREAAARDAALEECAKIAATWKAASPFYRGPERQAFEDGGERTARILADRINALRASSASREG